LVFVVIVEFPFFPVWRILVKPPLAGIGSVGMAKAILDA